MSYRLSLVQSSRHRHRRNLHNYYYYYCYYYCCFQENAGTALPRDTAVCHSGIAGDFTTAAQERVEGGDGAQSLLATPG